MFLNHDGWLAGTVHRAPWEYQPRRPLAEDVDRLRRYIRQHDIGYVVVDSVALACDGPPEAAAPMPKR